MAQQQMSAEMKPNSIEDAGGGLAWKSVRPEGAMRDLMEGDARREVPCLDHGMVALVDVMPRLAPEGQTADQAIVQAARVSYGAGTKRVNEDRGLIRYLLRHRHTTPFEMVEFKFHCAMPIFIARQWIRHRTASVNEYSGRYSIMPERFYRPNEEDVRKQSATNRQGGEEPMEPATTQRFLELLDRAHAMHAEYMALNEEGLARELARIALPQSLYTEWYWKIDLHNLLHFLALRIDAHAQREIRVYAQAMLDLIEPMVPVTVEAFRDYRLESMQLTRLEVEALRAGSETIDSTNKREQAEWKAKRAALGLD
jgi:thymidylate synthase (FAD)